MKIQLMQKAYISSQTEINTKAIGWISRCMLEGTYNIRMEINMMVISKKTQKMDIEYITTLTDINTKVNG